jgi:environmental stress-induced protein Ves
MDRFWGDEVAECVGDGEDLRGFDVQLKRRERLDRDGRLERRCRGHDERRAESSREKGSDA